MPFRPGRRPALAHDIRLAIAGRSVSFLADTTAVFTATLALQSRGAHAAVVALVLIANALPIGALAGPVGRLVDRLDNRRLLLVSGAGQTVGALALVAAIATRAPLGVVLALIAALGVGQAVNGACWQALLASLADGAALTRAVARTQAGRMIAGIAAPALSGVLLGALGAPVALAVAVAAYAAVTGLAAAVRVGRTPVTSDLRSDGSDTGDAAHGALALVRRDRVLRAVFLLLGTFVVVGGAVNVVEIFLVRVTLGGSATTYGLVAGTLGVGMVAGATAAGRIRGVAGLVRWLVISLAVMSTTLVASGLAPDIGWLFATTAVCGLANGVLNVTTNAVVLGRAAPAARGRIAALLGGVTFGGQVFAFAIGGVLAGVVSPRELFVAGGLLGLLTPLVLARRLLRAVDGPGPDTADRRPVARTRLSETSPTTAERGSGAGPTGRTAQADFSRRSRAGASRGTSVGYT